jgi:hypothetical protein
MRTDIIGSLNVRRAGHGPDRRAGHTPSGGRVGRSSGDEGGAGELATGKFVDSERLKAVRDGILLLGQLRLSDR